MQSKEKKILIVEDNPDIVEFLQDLLEEEGYTLAITDKVQYMEEMHGVNLPNLILLDVLLSGKDGREIVKHLKNQEETRHIPVIMFSAHPGAEETARKAGADDFIAKPFEMDDLLAKIAQCL